MSEQQIKELTAEQFLERAEMSLLPYDIPGKGRVFIRKITNLEFKKWTNRIGKSNSDDLYNDAALIQLCVCDKDGKQLLTTGQIPRIVSLFEDEIFPLANACADFNGVGSEAERRIRKNLSIPGEDS